MSFIGSTDLMVSRQLVPSVGEKEEYVADSVDPLSEDEYIVSPQCIHKYEE
jgi:L-lysine 2,3-aminomutase